MINEDDCDSKLPTAAEDPYNDHRGARGSRMHATKFVAVIQVVQLFAALQRALKSSKISLHTLQSMDKQIRSKLALLPESCHPDSDMYLDTAALSPILALQTARFHLYRRNLSPVCQQAERAAALESCTVVAQDTARYISRALQIPSGKPDPEQSWSIRVAHMASNMICIHIWRCILILCLRGDYAAALTCLQIPVAIGDVRKLNQACGKNLVFFLDKLMGRVRNGNGSQRHLEYDEEMLAYASGDLQSHLEHSWVWAGTDSMSGAEPSSAGSHHSARSQGSTEPMQGTLPLRPSPSSPENATKDWDDWGQVKDMITQLMEDQRPRIAPGPTPSYYPPPHNPMKRVQLTPDAPPNPPKTMPSSSASRISIANII